VVAGGPPLCDGLQAGVNVIILFLGKLNHKTTKHYSIITSIRVT
jgi:hypothetical protein